MLQVASGVTVSKYPTFADLLGFFRALHQAVASGGITSIYVHLDSGLMRWCIALYQCAEEYPELVRKIYTFNKLTAEIEMIQPYQKLIEMEAILLQLIHQSGKVSLTDLHLKYAQKFEEKSWSYILKTVNTLAEKGLITEVKVGRTKWVELTNLGKARQMNGEDCSTIKEQLV